MECRLIEVVDVSRLPRGASLVLGEVVRFHVDDRVVSNYVIDPDKLRAVGRMSANSYVRTRDRFELIRPGSSTYVRLRRTVLRSGYSRTHAIYASFPARPSASAPPS